MGWTWRYETAAGAVVEVDAALSPGFPSQADAETWIGETWRELAEAGVDQVLLLDDGSTVYGPMSLHT